MQTTQIHPTAIVEPGAQLGEGVQIGPFSIVKKNVQVGDRAVIHSHVVLDGHTELGEAVEVFPQACVGLRPQDLKYDGSPTRLVVGARTVIRECATLQPGSTGGACRGLTEVGADCLIMAYCHIAHDCAVGDRVIMANATQIAGHCVIEDHAILGGVTTVHQFVRIGTRAITGASSRVQMDVPPFMMADGHPAKLYGLNNLGLKRAGFSADSIRALKRAYKTLFLQGKYAQALDELEGAPQADADPAVVQLVRFLRQSERGVTRAPARKG